MPGRNEKRMEPHLRSCGGIYMRATCAGLALELGCPKVVGMTTTIMMECSSQPRHQDFFTSGSVGAGSVQPTDYCKFLRVEI
jgi:hypothetical protein